MGAAKLHVGFDGDCLHEQLNISFLNVATVLAKMKGDAIGAALFGKRGSDYRIGLVGTPGLTNRSDVINVYAKFEQGRNPSKGVQVCFSQLRQSPLATHRGHVSEN